MKCQFLLGTVQRVKEFKENAMSKDGVKSSLFRNHI